MIKNTVFFLLGAALMYLYTNPGDVDGMVEVSKDALNQGAIIVKELTD